ncbi:MAG: AAA family ATPase [Chloroflexi bacterium]|nr:AAA family ATPase [Chloroflexota bacterium]
MQTVGHRAEHFANMSRPFIIVVTGRPGSGKTTLAHELSKRIHCPVFCRDEFKEGYVL